ncbi:MAG: GntR family transcriptional regulator [Lachnospiraceae bacterium]|nr:GntR family transcriptional regulator [Lachnospiraceae bacterium]
MKDTQLLQVQAYDYLIDLIKKGELEFGKIYSLNKMAQKAGVSRTPFRDAVLCLEQERYLDVFPSKGFALHNMTREDIIETYQIRNAIEVYCLKQLTLNLNTSRGQEYFLKLSQKIANQQEIIQTTYSNEDFGRKDYEFHRSIVQYTANESMLEIYRRFMYRIFWLNVTSFSKEGRMADTITEHMTFLEMMQTGDLHGLETLTEHHLTVAQDINLQLLEQHPTQPMI